MRVFSPSVKRQMTSNLAFPPTLASLTVAGGSTVTAISRSKSFVTGPADRCNLVCALLGRPRASRSSTSTLRTTSGYQTGYPSTASTRARHCASGAATSVAAAPRSSFITAIYALQASGRLALRAVPGSYGASCRPGYGQSAELRSAARRRSQSDRK
jgi:hypothetical protein